MNRNFLLSLLVVAMGVIAFVGCEREQIVPNEGQQQRADDPTVQPNDSVEFRAVEVDMSEYHKHHDATGWPCNCVDFDTAFIINSQSQMESLIGECHDSLPTIDFESGTLVYVLNDPPDYLVSKKTSFDKITDSSYKFTVNLYMGDITFNPPVSSAYYVVPKLNGNETITVIKNEYEYTGE